jgi:hypothetical protein
MVTEFGVGVPMAVGALLAVISGFFMFSEVPFTADFYSTLLVTSRQYV